MKRWLEAIVNRINDLDSHYRWLIGITTGVVVGAILRCFIYMRSF